MRPPRRVAVTFDPDQLDLRRRGILAGVARFARSAPHWRWVLDPFALRAAPGAYDGILTPAGGRAFRARDRSLTRKVFVTWGDRQRHLPRVVENRCAAGREAVRHLLERGYPSFAYLGFTKECPSAIERQSFALEIGRMGRRVSVLRLNVGHAIQQAPYERQLAALDAWLGRLEPPVGLFVARPGLARMAAEIALLRGLRIPEDLGLVVADNDPVLCEDPPPALTSLHFDYAEVGLQAAALLDRLMDGESPPARALLIPPTLVPRLSTDRTALADPLVARALWFIDTHRTEAIRPCHVADAVGVRLRTLEDHVRRARGRTVLQEILRERVEHAKLFLAEADGSVAFAARMAGFRSAVALRRAFQRHLGTTPAAWQREELLRRRGSPDAEDHRKRSSHSPRHLPWSQT
jgi:LacI family transcriptional regulator